MPIRVDFLPAESHGLNGRVGLTFAPGKRDGLHWWRDLEADLDRLRNHYETGHLVSLMETFEYDRLQIADLVQGATARGICVHRFPIVDGCAPRDDEMQEFIRLLQHIEKGASLGKVVVIHCRGGLGRAGMVAAGFLVLRGHTPTDAIKTVRVARSPNAVETPAQEAWVERVSRELRTDDVAPGTCL